MLKEPLTVHLTAAQYSSRENGVGMTPYWSNMCRNSRHSESQRKESKQSLQVQETGNHQKGLKWLRLDVLSNDRLFVAIVVNLPLLKTVC